MRSFSITFTMVLSTTKNTGEIDVIINQRLIRLSYFAGNPLFRRLQCPWVTMTQLQILGALIRWYLIFKHIIRRKLFSNNKRHGCMRIITRNVVFSFHLGFQLALNNLLIRLLSFSSIFQSSAHAQMICWIFNHTIHVRCRIYKHCAKIMTWIMTYNIW